MVPSAPPPPSSASRFIHPDPISIETLKRHPMYQSQSCSGSDQDSDPKTLTRLAEPENCYMNVSISKKPAAPPQQLQEAETYVDMSTLRPPPQELLLSLQSNHDYVNRPRTPNGFSPASSGADYFDPITAQKLIENVQSLMTTAKEQAKEILNLKMTVKDLKLKVEALEQLNTEEFEYAE